MSAMRSWVFLRGLTRESRHWGDFIAQFQEAMPQDKIIPLDFPGNGQLHLQRSPTAVAAMVEHCREQLTQAGLEPPYSLLAMSLGGMVAVDWAARYPREIAANVLINTSMRPFSPFYERLRPANYWRLLGLALRRTSPTEWEKAIRELTSNGETQDVLPRWLELRLQSPVSMGNALRQLWAAARFRAPRKPPAVPTLVLSSRADHLVSVNCSLALSRSWQCAVRLHAQAGHDLPLDDGPWVVQQVQDWLR